MLKSRKKDQSIGIKVGFFFETTRSISQDTQSRRSSSHIQRFADIIPAETPPFAHETASYRPAHRRCVGYLAVADDQGGQNKMYIGFVSKCWEALILIVKRFKMWQQQK